ncbi:MAG: cbb3-type cytochrome c oxidase N-terminal domain-containing protein [Ignavibacteria bacterium]
MITFTIKRKNYNNRWTTVLLFIILLLINSSVLFAQWTVDTVAINGASMSQWLETASIIFGIVTLVFLWYIIVYATRPKTSEAVEARAKVRAMIKSRLDNAVPIGKENSILLEDNFDGIFELDNKVPPWFNILLYGTIIIGIFYLLNFHVFTNNKLMIDEYEEEVQVADLQKEILFRSGRLVTESNVTELKDIGSIQNGRQVFLTRCSVCHGRQGEGLIGPNLTDDYWIHGGGITNIFKTVKYGWPAKGMISWQSQLSPKQIQEVASFVISLHDTHPPNAKPPQGVKNEAPSAVDDSTKKSI